MCPNLVQGCEDIISFCEDFLQVNANLREKFSPRTKSSFGDTVVEERI